MNEYIVFGASMIERRRVAELNRDCERRRQQAERAEAPVRGTGFLSRVAATLRAGHDRRMAGGASERARTV
ncbi:hypothetical protein L2X99_03065 [Microbacterium sp. KUDC0406]|uniref:hypothetical protein n=1 Tax=Microbacterium sp. KUDC0406 TaxID=2909588 RepID=UPI001F3FA76D|nr:hypothetical protein [Microbacterium sp. KUDC0406]UJP10667.1 hypothetical protein L2X99_03065 [Microbacterium sp. KUDC0406]